MIMWLHVLDFTLGLLIGGSAVAWMNGLAASIKAQEAKVVSVVEAQIQKVL